MQVEEKVVIQRADDITSLMEARIPELQSQEHEDARPYIAYTPCGAAFGPIWACRISRGGWGVFMPEHSKHFAYDDKMEYLPLKEGECIMDGFCRCTVIKIRHVLALQFEAVGI